MQVMTMPANETADKKAEKPNKVPVKTKTLEEAKQLILEMRKTHEDWYIRKIIGKTQKLLTGAKKGKNVDECRKL
jgi:hypothetical protein